MKEEKGVAQIGSREISRSMMRRKKKKNNATDGNLTRLGGSAGSETIDDGRADATVQE